MDKIVGIRSIINVSEKNVAISVVVDAQTQKQSIVGKNTPVALAETWIITQKPGESDLYTIYSASYKKYLAHIDDTQIALLSGTNAMTKNQGLLTDERLEWRIDKVDNSNYYKIQAYNGRNVFSLKSNNDIVLDAYANGYEQWFLNLAIIPGPKRIISVAFPDRAITYGNPAYGEGLHNHSDSSMQRWTISEPEDNGAYVVYNDFGGYLGWDDKTALVSSDSHLWNIVDVDHNTGRYKLEAHQIRKVCSLQSRTYRASVFMRDYKGKEEEWTLEDYPDPPQGQRSG